MFSDCDFSAAVLPAVAGPSSAVLPTAPSPATAAPSTVAVPSPAAIAPSPPPVGDQFHQFYEGPYVQRNLYVGEICTMYNHPRIMRELATREQCVQFAEEQRLIATVKKCSSHKRPMRVEMCANNSVGAFVCSRGRCRGKSQKSRAIGTWFANIKISLPHVFYIMYAYAHRWSYDQTIFEDHAREGDKCLARGTVADWYNYCREVVVIYQLAKQDTKGKIGGPGKIVQIDESKFGKRKYNKGRHVEGHWVLGLIEDGSEDLRLEVCPDNIRSAEVLVPIIKKHVAEGTTIHTDFWRAYDCLGDHGFIHRKVNHSDPDNPFVAPDGVHTQRIESQWRVVKRFFSKDNYNHPANFGDMIVEYLWRRDVQRRKGDPFLALIDSCRYVYPVRNDEAEV